MLMIANHPVNLKLFKKAGTFSMQNKGLIKKAYPWVEGSDFRNLCEKIDLFVSQSEENFDSAIAFLKGRVFGLTGEQ